MHEQLISEKYLVELLEMYTKKNTRYVKNARTTIIVPEQKNTDIIVKAELSVQLPVYLDHSSYYGNNGHFNAVEFIICANQLGYIYFAALALNQRLNLKDKMVDFNQLVHQKMIDDIYIAKIKEVKFKKPIKPKNFFGEFRIKKEFDVKHTKFFDVEINFYDDEDGYATGQILSAIKF